ncbi:MAG: DUF3106 domain-containing protein [Planctomycetia bacterium]
MRLPSTPARVLLLALAALLAAWLPAPALRAQEADPLARLTPDERRVLEQRLPGLASLPAERREQVVRNVERLRGLTPTQRTLVERRLDAARAAGVEPRELAEREQAWRGLGERRPLAEGLGRAIRALGARAWADLPEALRTHAALAPLEASSWPLAFHARFARRAAQAQPEEQVRAWQPPAGTPEPWRADFERARARALADPDAARGLADLRRRVLLGRTLAAAAEPPPPGGEGGRLALGARLAALAPAAYAETLAEFRSAGEARGAEALATLVGEGAEAAQRHEGEKLRRLQALQAVMGLEAAAPWIAGQPALQAPADLLLRAALVGELGMPAATFEALPARAAGEARAQALRAWLEQSLPRDLRRAGLPRRGPERPQPPAPGALPGGPRRGEGPRER